MLLKIKIPKLSKTVILLFGAHYKHRNRISQLFSILYYLITLTSFTYFIDTQSARFILI